MTIEVVDLSSELDTHYFEILKLWEDCENLAEFSELSLDRLKKTESYETASVEALLIMNCAADALALTEAALLTTSTVSAMAEPPSKPDVPQIQDWIKLCEVKEAYASVVQAQLRCFRLMAEATLELALRPDCPERPPELPIV